MKILRNYAIMATLTSVILLYSCREDDVNPGQQVRPNRLIIEAKAWHQSKTNSPGFLSLLRADQLILQPIWRKAELVDLTDGRQVIFAPAQDFEMKNPEIEFQRGFLFAVNKGEITDGKIVEFYSKDSHLSSPEDLPKKFISQEMTGFSGSVIVYDLLYQRFSSVTYEDGVKVVGSISSIRRKFTAGNSQRANTMCYDVYWVTTVGGYEFWDYSYTYCDDPWGGGGGGGGGENPGGPGPEPGQIEQPASEPEVGDDPNAVPIPNVPDHLRCFNRNSHARVTIYVDQPIPQSNAPITFPRNVGHSWITIQQNGVTRTIGFYPQTTADASDPIDNSQLMDNANKPWDVSAGFDISADELASLLNFIENGTPDTYDLNDYNCTDWVIEAFGNMGITLPANEVTWPLGGGLCPGQFGEDLRFLNLPGRLVDHSHSWESGNAPANSGNCN